MHECWDLLYEASLCTLRTPRGDAGSLTWELSRDYAVLEIVEDHIEFYTEHNSIPQWDVKFATFEEFLSSTACAQLIATFPKSV